jgi:hypothetical protein
MTLTEYNVAVMDKSSSVIVCSSVVKNLQLWSTFQLHVTLCFSFCKPGVLILPQTSGHIHLIDSRTTGRTIYWNAVTAFWSTLAAVGQALQILVLILLSNFPLQISRVCDIWRWFCLIRLPVIGLVCVAAIRVLPFKCWSVRCVLVLDLTFLIKLNSCSLRCFLPPTDDVDRAYLWYQITVLLQAVGEPHRAHWHAAGWEPLRWVLFDGAEGLYTATWQLRLIACNLRTHVFG